MYTAYQRMQELKVFRMADSLLDTLVCVPSTRRSTCMLVGAREILLSLEHVISAMGDPKSTFLTRLRQGMAQANFPPSVPPHLTLPADSEAAIESTTHQTDTSVSSPSQPTV